MMILRELLASCPELFNAVHHPALEQPITALVTNSQQCQPNSLFLGMPGTRVDGGEFWPEALEAGAIAAIISPEAFQKCPPAAMDCVMVAADLVAVSARLAAVLNDYPTRHLQLVGVTGTNGKTTTTHLIEFFLQRAQRPTALLGTLYSRWPGYQKTATHTTPFASELQEQLSLARRAGSRYAVMEVSSHALSQGRVRECEFEAAVFTNLTQDHLDFHQTMENYFAAKALLFSPSYLRGRAILNREDGYGQKLMASLATQSFWTYGVQDQQADFYTRDLMYGLMGVMGTLITPQGELAFRSPLVGQFNLANVLAAIACGVHLGLAVSDMVSVLPEFTGVPGRMEQVKIQKNQDISVVVDYAHTPDSLENALKAARPFIPGRLICVFGCGGDRDRTKRPLMGHIASQLADQVIVTSDNPRTEDPQQILEDVMEGVLEPENSIVIGDRATAIHQAIGNAQTGDGVLIAGKGHEDYQILGTEKIHFDDREQARAALTIRLRNLGLAE